MYDYQAVVAANAKLRKLKPQGAGPPDSIPAYLRSLHVYLTPKAVAKILGHHRETIYGWISAGLPARKQGRSWRIDSLRLAIWLERK
jgi:excisionase family DNA binding protein